MTVFDAIMERRTREMAEQRIEGMRRSLINSGTASCTFFRLPLEDFSKEQLITILCFKFGQTEFGVLPKEADDPILVMNGKR